MRYIVLGDDSDGWLVVYYTRATDGRRVIFEVSSSPRYSSEESAHRAATNRLKDLVDAANAIEGSFPGSE